MPRTGDYDVMFQFEQGLVNDVLARVLVDPVTLALDSPRVLPRRLAYPAPPPDARALLWWERPAYVLRAGGPADAVEVLLPIHGGIRRQRTIYSVDGVVRMRRPVRVRADAAGAIYLAMEPAEPTGIDLSRLRLHHAGAPQPARAILSAGPSEVLAALLLLAPQLLQVPISYTLGSLALPLLPAPSAPTAPATPGGNAAVPARSAAAVGVGNGEVTALALGIALTDRPHPPSASMSCAFPPRAAGLRRMVPFLAGRRPNAALSFSAGGLTRIFAHLRDAGGLEGIAVLPPSPPAGRPVPPPSAPRTVRWGWHALTVRCAADIAILSGDFALDDSRAPVTAAIRTWLDDHGRLQAQPAPIGPADTARADPPRAAAIAASWKALLLRVLRAGPAPDGGRDRHPADALLQRFTVPETGIAVEAAAMSLLLSEGELTVLYAVPLSFQEVIGQVIGQIK